MRELQLEALLTKIEWGDLDPEHFTWKCHFCGSSPKAGHSENCPLVTQNVVSRGHFIYSLEQLARVYELEGQKLFEWLHEDNIEDQTFLYHFIRYRMHKEIIQKMMLETIESIYKNNALRKEIL